MYILFGTIFLIVIPYSALGDMMERTTPGDMVFFVVEIFLAFAVVVSFLLWIVTLLIGRKTKVSRPLGYTTLALGGALCLSILMGQIYYHYIGYGAYKKARHKMIHTCGLLKQIEAGYQGYFAEHGLYPTSEEQKINAFREFVQLGSNENIRQGVLLDSWEMPIACTFEGNKVAVRSAGPDRKFNTKDDLTNTGY